MEAFLFKDGKFKSERISNSKIDVTPSKIVIIKTKVKIMEWEDMVNKSKLPPNWMIECSKKVAWSMAKSKIDPNKKMSVRVFLPAIKKIKWKMC